jgi:hypothetical protein
MKGKAQAVKVYAVQVNSPVWSERIGVGETSQP